MKGKKIKGFLLFSFFLATEPSKRKGNQVSKQSTGVEIKIRIVVSVSCVYNHPQGNAIFL